MSLLINFVFLIGTLSVVLGAEISTQATSANCWNAITPGSDFFHPLSSGFVRSRHGYLDTRLHYKQSAGDKGSYCYLLEDSEIRSPTLRAFPGDNMLVTLSNELNLKTQTIFALPTNNYCTTKVATFSSTNMHFHGIHSPPFCHDDNVVMSVIPTGKSFTYNVEIPISQPPGLYWYHPHMHEVAFNQVTGGASGLIVIEGIQKIQPIVAGKREQVIAIRDYNSTSINFIAVNSTNAVPMRVVPNDLQFWRIGNIGADQQRNLTYSWGGQIRPFQVIAIDGVTVGDGLAVSTVEVTHYLLTTGGRVEILLRTPPLNNNGVLSDHHVAQGDPGSGPAAVLNLIDIIPDNSAPEVSKLPEIDPLPNDDDEYIGQIRGQQAVLNYTQRIPNDLLNVKPHQQRNLTFSQLPNFTAFFITVHGAEPVRGIDRKVFNISAPPSITATQGTTEDWFVENRSPENHVFHIHQMHFVLMQRDGKDVSVQDQQYYDTINIPFCEGNYSNTAVKCPSVKLRMDFTGDVVGKFVYHCHILFHEDHGMMAIIQVVPCPEGAGYCREGVSLNSDGDDKHTTYLIAIGVLAGIVGLIILIIFVVSVIYYERIEAAAAAWGAISRTPTNNNNNANANSNNDDKAVNTSTAAAAGGGGGANNKPSVVADKPSEVEMVEEGRGGESKVTSGGEATKPKTDIVTSQEGTKLDDV